VAADEGGEIARRPERVGLAAAEDEPAIPGRPEVVDDEARVGDPGMMPPGLPAPIGAVARMKLSIGMTRASVSGSMPCR
jgi:hypothetical protein